jgi:copper(I)-binding protein
MRTKMMLFATALLCAVTLSAQDAAVAVRDAWVRVPSPSKTETALYMVIENHTAQKRALVFASSDAAEKVEMHQMTMNGKVMLMLPVAKIDIPARGKASLNPNGFHMMMYGLKKRPMPGDNVNVMLTLDDGTSLGVTATVKK